MILFMISYEVKSPFIFSLISCLHQIVRWRWNQRSKLFCLIRHIRSGIDEKIDGIGLKTYGKLNALALMAENLAYILCRDCLIISQIRRRIKFCFIPSVYRWFIKRYTKLNLTENIDLIILIFSLDYLIIGIIFSSIFRNSRGNN